MKIRLTTALAASCALLGTAGAACADDFSSGLYTVINYSGVYPSFKRVADVSTPAYLDGVEADIGWRFNRFYSIEASYDYDTGSKQSAATTLNTTLQSGSIDALGYLPLGRGSDWALYGDIGGSVYFGQEENTTGGANVTRFGGRLGGGVQYQLSDNLGLRVGGRYELTDLSTLKHAEMFAVGLVWQR